ncbi:hypothetical protein F7725_023412, partial [Dissostichus mawsoni]
MSLTRTPQQDSSALPQVSVSPLQSFSAGPSCKLLTKNAVWDASSGSLLQKLQADLPVLDISPFSVKRRALPGIAHREDAEALQ